MFGLKIVKESVIFDLETYVKELENKTHDLELKVKHTKSMYDNEVLDYKAFKEQVNGLHSCTRKCRYCEHSYVVGSNIVGGRVAAEYSCALDIPCEDFKIKED